MNNLCFLILILILTSSCENKIGNQYKINIGYHLIGDDSLFLNESEEKMRLKWGDFFCNYPEDHCLIKDTICFGIDTIPVDINFTISSSLVTNYWVNIPIKDTLLVKDFIHWKKWNKKEPWNYYLDSNYIIQYRFKDTGNSYVLLLGAEVGDVKVYW